MKSKIQRIIDLVKKTGDTVVVFDEKTDESYVVMNLEEYENLISDFDFIDDDIVNNKTLTEDNLVDKINRDIAMWKSDNDEDVDTKQDQDIEEINDIDTEKNSEANEYNEVEDENLYYYDEDQSHGSLENSQNKSSWQIPPEVKKEAELVI